MPYVRHRFGKTYFRAQGKKSAGIPFVALHGGPGGTSGINELFFKLARNRKVYIYDQIGGGRSSPTPKSKWTMKDPSRRARHTS